MIVTVCADVKVPAPGAKAGVATGAEVVPEEVSDPQPSVARHITVKQRTTEENKERTQTKGCFTVSSIRVGGGSNGKQKSITR